MQILRENSINAHFGRWHTGMFSNQISKTASSGDIVCEGLTLFPVIKSAGKRAVSGEMAQHGGPMTAVAAVDATS